MSSIYVAQSRVYCGGLDWLRFATIIGSVPRNGGDCKLYEPLCGSVPQLVGIRFEYYWVMWFSPEVWPGLANSFCSYAKGFFGLADSRYERALFRPAFAGLGCCLAVQVFAGGLRVDGAGDAP